MKLTTYYKGKTSWLLGTIELTFRNSKYRISRTSRGAGNNNNVGGSFPVLWTYVKPSPKIIIGNSKAKKFTSGKFIFLPPNEEIDVSGQSLFVGSDQSQIIERMKHCSNNDEVIQAVSLLFSQPFQHLTVSTEIHFIGFVPRKMHVFRYVCLPEKIYEDPKILQDYFNSFETCIACIGLEIDSSF